MFEYIKTLKHHSVITMQDRDDCDTLIAGLHKFKPTPVMASFTYQNRPGSKAFVCPDGALIVHDRFIDVFSDTKRFLREIQFASRCHKRENKVLTYIALPRIQLTSNQTKGFHMTKTIFQYAAFAPYYLLATTSAKFAKLDPTGSHVIKAADFAADTVALFADSGFDVPSQITLNKFVVKNPTALNGAEAFKAEEIIFEWLDVNDKPHRDNGLVASLAFRNLRVDFENNRVTSYLSGDYRAVWNKHGEKERQYGPCEMEGLIDCRLNVAADGTLTFDLDSIEKQGWTTEALEAKNIKSWTPAKGDAFDPRYFEAVQNIAITWTLPGGGYIHPQSLHNAIHHHKFDVNIFNEGDSALKDEIETVMFFNTIANDSGDQLVDHE